MKALLANDVTGPSAVLSTNQSCFVAFKSQAFSARRPCEESLKVYLEIHISCEKSRGPGNSKDVFGKGFLKQVFCQTHPSEIIRTKQTRSGHTEALARSPGAQGTQRIYLGMFF